MLESGTLGGQQSLLSQGIIHGGLKYALGGTLSSESEAIAGMPDRWRQCLRGEGDVDLSGVRVLSDTQHLWSAGSMASRVTTFFASRMLRGRIQKLKRDQFPSALSDRAFRGQVYQLDDLVIDTESLIRQLSHNLSGQLLAFDPERDSIQWNDQGVEKIAVGNLQISPGITVLAAGLGNAALLSQAHQHDLALDIHDQARPLHMVMVRHRLGHRLYAHCVGTSNKPRLTVTTHARRGPEAVWYLGGELAEEGVDRSPAAQIEAARLELGSLLPWVELGDVRWATLRIDRAEPRQADGSRPAEGFADWDRRVITVWPTKLALVPLTADRVLALLEARDIRPVATDARPDWPAPACAPPPWEEVQWS